MKFRRRLLIAFTAIVVLSVLTVAIVVSGLTRRSFERADAERTTASLHQFDASFAKISADVNAAIQMLADSEAITRMTAELSAGADPALFLSEARTLADSRQLDFMDILKGDGTIISSAEAPARFGYKEQVDMRWPKQSAFLRIEQLTTAAQLGIFATRTVTSGGHSYIILGGRTLDRSSISALGLPPGMRAAVVSDGVASNQNDLGPAAASLVDEVRAHKETRSSSVRWSRDPADVDYVIASPLTTPNGDVAAVLLVASSRRAAIELQRNFRDTAMIVAGIGVLVAILLSGWIAARITHPLEALSTGVARVSAGDLTSRVEIESSDEIGQLAAAFNTMTEQLVDSRERLVQSERVAAWRELARRLAHELKNPLFPLQLTIENMVRARDVLPEEFDEIFREGSQTLLAELANMKAIIGRFSDFSKMPKPSLQAVAINEVVDGVVRFLTPQTKADGRPKIGLRCDLDPQAGIIHADSQLLHRALSNLILNAFDALPSGGTVTVSTARKNDSVLIEVADDGVGLTPEECDRLFTPYYTSKQHGTGLGLAIVQSVIADHGGKITVSSSKGAGTVFHIELPAEAKQTSAAATMQANS